MTKNIHILPTDKPNNGYVFGKCIKELADVKIGEFTRTHNLMFSNEYFQAQNIYITSDEKIKEGYVLNTFNNTIYKIVPDNSSREILSNPTILPLCSINKEHYFKIILTTDQDLIGVQAIDDEFLEWFLKNPNCEEVRVEKLPYGGTKSIDKYWGGEYKIIIKETGCVQTNCRCEKEEPNPFELPKALPDDVFYESLEPKQETVEEAAYKDFNKNVSKPYCCEISQNNVEESFIRGIKWQQERSYSEEEVLKIIELSCEQGMLIQRTINDKVKIPYFRIKEFKLKLIKTFNKVK